MKDRVPRYPGRVKMIPVAGQANTYDMERADQPTQQGTPINKASMLKDATAALFGLGTDAVPDAVLAWLGKYNQHWWSKRTPEVYGYAEKQTDMLDRSGYYYQWYIKNTPKTIQYSKEITIDQATGAVSLKNPISFTATKYSSFYGNEKTLVLEEFAALAPCYITGLYKSKYGYKAGTLSDEIIFLPANCTYRWKGSTTTLGGDNNGYASDHCFFIHDYSSVAPPAKRISSEHKKIHEAGDTIYLHSANRNAYPDSGTQDGYEYAYLGVPFQNIISAPRFAAGTYIGTGLYGADNPSTLVFDFIPKVVIINRKLFSESDGLLVYVGQPGQAATGSGNEFSCIGTTLSWYSKVDAANQWNSDGATYYYVAFG